MPCRAGVLKGRLTERVPGHHAGQVFSQVGLQRGYLDTMQGRCSHR